MSNNNNNNIGILKNDIKFNQFINFLVNESLYTLYLDQEDLDYLYNKYYKQYTEAVIERDEKLKLAKQKEIEALEIKLNKLKNE